MALGQPVDPAFVEFLRASGLSYPDPQPAAPAPPQVGPELASPIEETPAPIDPPPFAPVVDDPHVVFPPHEQPAQAEPLEPVGSGLDQFGFRKETAAVPPRFDHRQGAGLRVPGNIDLDARPIARNPDGSISTVRSISIGTEHGEVLIPTVSEDGRILSDDEAVALYQKTGRHLGIFDTPENATSFANALHDAQEAQHLSRPAPIEQRQRTSTQPGEQSLTTEEILGLDPLQRTAYLFDEQQKREDFANARMAEIQRTDAARQEQAERDFADAQARSRQMTEAALVDAEALANEKPQKFTDSIGNVISSLAGIFISSLAGKGDQAVAIVQQRMDRFAQEQLNEYNRKAGNVDRRLNIAARLRDAGYNDFQTASVIRMAGLARARDQLMTDLQQFDPKGTAAMKRAQAIQQTEAAIAQNAEAMRRQGIEDQIKEVQLAKGQLEVAEKVRKLRGVGGASVKAGNLSGEQVTKMLKDAGFKNVVPVPEKPGGYTPAEAKQRVELGGKVVEEERKTRGRFVEGVVGADGKPFEFPEDAGKFREAKAAFSELNALIGDLVRDIDEHGGEVNFLRSNASKRYQVRAAQIGNRLRTGFKMGTLDEGSQKMLDKMQGGDPSAFIGDAAAGLRTLRNDLVRSFNIELQQQPGYDGPGWNPAFGGDLKPAGANADDQEMEGVIKASYLPSAKILEMNRSMNFDFDPLGSQEHVDTALAKLEKRARANDAASAGARARLEAISKKAVAEDVRRRAAEILKTIPTQREGGAR